ncbi:nck-associated protein 5 isoform X1 [Falco peregrinus]|uniref:nck-associated protein 5 isoform X1 n=3 Tax=Falco peregrinus TaxID=8954 RepID=UPI00247A2B62|nr:nck-associated protein 5 isoform X1 [Falco peregrinus]
MAAPAPPRRGEPLLPAQLCRSHSLATDCDRGRWAGSDSPAPPRGRGRRGPAAALPAPPKVPPRAPARPPQAHVPRPAAAAGAGGEAAAAEQSGRGERRRRGGRPGGRRPLCPGGGRRRRGAPRPAGTRCRRPPQHAPPPSREKLSVARLQREVAQSKSEGAMREKLIHELEEERHLRLESEKRLREVTLESERSRAQMRGLQEQFSRMEETVRNLLESQGSPGQHGEGTVNIMKVYQEKLSEDSRKCKEGMEKNHTPADEDSRSESSSTEEEKERTKLLLERLKALEAENSALALENENQREQYERCLDEVANQVVQALLTQKDLREECIKLKMRVFDLEQQNRTLSVLFQQKVKPASDLLLQKLHSRILDLSSGDLLSEVERNRSLMQSRTADAQIHECQQNVKSSIPVLKCQSQLNMTGPIRLYPRSSCSSSELSLSSACSEYSSGSSYTWNDGKICSKRLSVSWDKRVSIGSSLPSNLSSPADDLPPTRIKENHILEGLKKLQKQKVLLESPSVISKWGYKDCMNSNEGIYSPGVKCGSHNEQTHCKPMEIGSICIEHSKTFSYDSDLHDDADDDSSSLLLLQEAPSKDCRTCCNKLTHSVSDSLFDWDPNRKHLPERSSYFNSKERPEKLTSFVSGFQAELKSCTRAKLPELELNQSHANIGWKDLNFQLSDTDDNEVLDELHIESSDEKSPSDLLATPFTEKYTKTSDVLKVMENSQFVSTDKEENQTSSHSDIRPKTCNFIKQQKVIKKTSSEECITVIFDAEDGEPIEFSSHQTGVVTVTRNEISINQPQTASSAEYTELIPQGITDLLTETSARNYTALERPEDETEKKVLEDNTGKKNTVVPMTCSESSRCGKVTLQNTPRQKLVKPVYDVSYKANSSSTAHAGINQKPNLTKIPSRGKFSPQKIAVTESKETPVAQSVGPATLEKSPALPPVKLSRFKKAQSPPRNFDSKADFQVPKPPVCPLPGLKRPGRGDGPKCPKSQSPASPLLPQHLIEPSDYGEPPTRDFHCDLATVEARSPSPPIPPGRSTSLLIRPNYAYSPPVAVKLGGAGPSENAKNVLKSSPLKGTVNSGFHNQSSHEMQAKNISSGAKIELSYLQENAEAIMQNKCVSQQPHSACQGLSKVSVKQVCPKSPNQLGLHRNHEFSNTDFQTTRSFSLGCPSLETTSSQDAYSSKKDISSDSGVDQPQKMPSILPTTPQCHTTSTSEPLLSQVNNSPLSTLIHGTDAPHATQNSNEKGMKTRLPVGLKLFVKSPQLLRKSSTVPGKQEKDSINAASKSNVSSSKYRQNESICITSRSAMDAELKDSKSDTEIKNHLTVGLGMDTASPHSHENCSLVVDRVDGLENRLVKRSVSSSNKSHLKPALGMNGAKARSQSFSIHTGEKASTPVTEGLGKVRTQIITNTSDRGNSLTRQNSAMEGLQIKAVPGSAVTPETLSYTPKTTENSYSRQGSLGNMSSCNSQHGSPSKLPFRSSPKADSFHNTSRCDGNKPFSQKDARSLSVQSEKSTESFKHEAVSKKSVLPAELELEASATVSSKQISSFQSSDGIKCPHKLEVTKSRRQQMSLKLAETSEKVTHVLSSPALQPTIEEKVMLCIQENVQKGQGQTKSPTVETKQKTGPSIASWFGFRKSKLPALSSRKADVPKTKVEKKDVKVSGFGIKQAKLERRKEKKKTEQHCEIENEINRKTDNSDILADVMESKITKPSQDMPGEIECEQVKGSATATYSPKDSFMKELLNRVDKKAAQQTESGSNNVSYRSVSKGSSQGSSLHSNSISAQGNHKKNSNTKADMEMQNQTLAKVVTENLQEEEEDTMTRTTCQSHVIESCCQMRTLDSGIGTFPLPDSGNRSTGRHVSRQESALETEDLAPSEQVLLSPPSVKAKTLEREVPSTAKSQESVESIISHSTSDPAMTAKGIRPFQSRLPKPASSGIINLAKQSEQEPSSVTSASLEHTEETVENRKVLPEWTTKKTTKTKDRALRVCTYSASSSDTELEPEYETNYFRTAEETFVELTKNNKQAVQEKQNQRKSFLGNPMSILDLYQHSLCGHFGEDGPEQLTHYSLIEQLSGASSKDSKGKESPTKLKQTEETKEDSQNRLSKISLESLNKFNSNNVLLLEKEKNCLNKVEGQKEENGKKEAASLNSSGRHDVDNLESLSDSLYDSFSSCASQGSNDV